MAAATPGIHQLADPEIAGYSDSAGTANESAIHTRRMVENADIELLRGHELNFPGQLDLVLHGIGGGPFTLADAVVETVHLHAARHFEAGPSPHRGGFDDERHAQIAGLVAHRELAHGLDAL